MDIKHMFDGCQSIEPFNTECKELLDRIMAIKSPVEFDEEFATDEQLEMLEAELDRFNRRSREGESLLRVISGLVPYQSNEFIFIG